MRSQLQSIAWGLLGLSSVGWLGVVVKYGAIVVRLNASGYLPLLRGGPFVLFPVVGLLLFGVASLLFLRHDRPVIAVTISIASCLIAFLFGVGW